MYFPWFHESLHVERSGRIIGLHNCGGKKRDVKLPSKTTYRPPNQPLNHFSTPSGAIINYINSFVEFQLIKLFAQRSMDAPAVQWNYCLPLTEEVRMRCAMWAVRINEIFTLKEMRTKRIFNQNNYRIKMRSQSTDRIFCNVRGQLAAGRSESKNADLLVGISDPFRNVPVEESHSAQLLSSPRCQQRFREEHLKRDEAIDEL